MWMRMIAGARAWERDDCRRDTEERLVDGRVSLGEAYS